MVLAGTQDKKKALRNKEISDRAELSNNNFSEISTNYIQELETGGPVEYQSPTALESRK